MEPCVVMVSAYSECALLCKLSNRQTARDPLALRCTTHMGAEAAVAHELTQHPYMQSGAYGLPSCGQAVAATMLHRAH